MRRIALALAASAMLSTAVCSMAAAQTVRSEAAEPNRERTEAEPNPVP